jgi:hypothetical protein
MLLSGAASSLRLVGRAGGALHFGVTTLPHLEDG